MAPFVAIFGGWTQLSFFSGPVSFKTLYKTWCYVLGLESNGVWYMRHDKGGNCNVLIKLGI